MPSLLDWGLPPEAPKPTESERVPLANNRVNGPVPFGAPLPESEPARTAEIAKPKSRSRSGRINANRRQGEHGTGALTFTPQDVADVVAVLRGTTYQSPVSVARICQAANLNGRTVRAILSERDGVDFLVGCAATGELFDATADVVGGGGFTLKLQSQVRRMAERVRRRQAFTEVALNEAAGLPR